jgi:hypothetical protein
MSTPVAYVYRCYDASGRLLYIGSTVDTAVRFRQHERTADWWPYVARTEVEAFDSTDAALAAETRAIGTEHPRWNVKDRSPDHPEGFATNNRGLPWLAFERQLGGEVRELRLAADRVRKRYREIHVNLRAKEALVAAISSGAISLSAMEDEFDELLADP